PGWICHASLSSSYTVIVGFNDAYGSWNTNCTWRRRFLRSERDSSRTSRPSKRTCPDNGSNRPTTDRATVDLPQPDSPTRHTVSPACTDKDTPATACTSRRRPNRPCRDRYPATRSTSSSTGVSDGFAMSEHLLREMTRTGPARCDDAQLGFV